MKEYEAQVFSKEQFGLGESPFYDPRTGLYSFVDILGHAFYLCSPEGGYTPPVSYPLDGSLQRFELGQEPGAAVPADAPGSYLIAGQDGLYLFAEGALSRKYDLRGEFEPVQRCNDAKADPAGRLFFGSSLLHQAKGEPHGNLYTLDGGVLTKAQPDTGISNGMAWSADRKRFFFCDSTAHRICSYDYEESTGRISGRRELFAITEGAPDGMCIDCEDNLYVAVWGGRRIEKRSTATGELLAVIRVASENVTSCCFGGEGMRTLLITTSRAEGDGLGGGKLFTCRMEVSGPAPDLCDIQKIFGGV